MRRLWLILSLALGSLALAGCEFDPSEWGGSDRYKEDFAYNHKLAPGGRVMLETFNGAVEVLGWDKDAVDITGTKYASREEVMRDIKIDIVSEADSIRIRAIRPIERNCNCGARFILKVPKKALLDNIQSSNGSLRVESITGNARLKTSNGGIRVWGLTGNLDATTSNGAIEVGQFQGAATLHTSNGRIKADGVSGAFEAHTSNASIDAQIASLEDGRAVVAGSSNGSINLTFDKWANNEIKASTSNSSVNVRLPEGIHADLRASTSNGNITTDFEITTSQFSKTRLNGRLNGGGALMSLSTSNGNIRLLKR
ncbi:MAG: DUF4097 family beta strand repeat protein [Candidatus Solibacter usitatus]|nr:DUF4097 family beta strand repeat protein [Candidatus Solibacter usitatus]